MANIFRANIFRAKSFRAQPNNRGKVALGLSALLLAAVISQGMCTPTHAASRSNGKTKTVVQAPEVPSLTVVGTSVDAPEVASIQAMLSDLVAASNRHDINGVLSHYSPRFISGDNLSLDQIRKLVEETWKLYPDIRYSSQVLEIRLNGNFATVETKDSATATAKADGQNDFGNQPGKLTSQSRGLLFLHRTGKTWEIKSDYTLYEEAVIAFGKSVDIPMHLTTPEQVLAGESYSARLMTELPKGTFAIASIARDPLVYPQPKPEEKFRTLNMDRNSLERVFDANHTNNNEIITAIVGLTEIGQDPESERPSIKLNGVATLVKRVNVLPKSQVTGENIKDKLIKFSASGAIDMRNQVSMPPAAEDTEDPSSTDGGDTEE